MKWLTVLLFIMITCLSCTKESNSSDQFSNACFTSFTFQSVHNSKFSKDIIADIDDSTITCSLPLGISPDSLVANFKTNDLVSSVTVSTTEQVSGTSMNNFIPVVTYTLHGRDNSTRSYRVSVKPFTGLPIIYLTTNGEAAITSKDDYVTGVVSVKSNFTGAAEFTSDMQIRLRGNYTSTLPKKPYKLKFASKTSMFGMPADKEWALLANYDDKTLMRTYLAFQVSQIFGLAYTPHSVFTEVFLNGVYQGNYQVCETVKIASSRVNIKSMAETDVSGSKLTGGYLLEVDNRLDGTDTFVTSRDIDFVIQDPEYSQAAQVNYIKNYVQSLEDAIYGSNFTSPTTGYAKYLDATSTIGWFWVNELSRNRDAAMGSSVFMYKDRDSILHMGPAWDFDLGFGNYKLVDTKEVSDPHGWYIRNAPWFERLFQDPAFTQKAIAKWTAVRSQLENLNHLIDGMANNLKYSALKDEERWGITNLYIYPENGVAGSYRGEVEFLKTWLSTRMKWIDTYLQTLQN